MKLETTAIKRILDANLDRAREGLRIIEEWCRFGLDNPDLAQECKEMRHQLASWHSIDLKRHRDTAGDIGRDLSHPREEIRETVEGLLQANLARVQEAFRVLEEYGKLYDLEVVIPNDECTISWGGHSQWRVTTCRNLDDVTRHNSVSSLFIS